MSPTITSTINLIKKAHAGQKYGTSPYWTHPFAVAEKGKELFGSKFGTSGYIAALLHDTVEDTDLTLVGLQNLGYSAQILDAVNLVTKDKSLSYEGNITRIIQSGNKLAMMVKFADNFMNYTGDKSHWPPAKAAKSQEKYMKSMKALGAVLGIDPEKIV
jgi:(p)ppGpp synthase/HD superfamily hydrolase